MYTPHTVTLINVIEGDDYAMQYNITVLHGVMLQASKRANVNKSGLLDADAVTLYIPFTVNATGPAGGEKRFVGPKAFEALGGSRDIWTLRGGSKSSAVGCFFIKGEISDGLSYAEALKTYDDVYRVTTVDTMDYGSASMHHWEVGGI